MWPDAQWRILCKEELNRAVNIEITKKQAIVMAVVNQSQVEESTEEWLDGIEDRLDYGKWYCGHYHTEKKVDRVEIMFENVDVF